MGTACQGAGAHKTGCRVSGPHLLEAPATRGLRRPRFWSPCCRLSWSHSSSGAPVRPPSEASAALHISPQQRAAPASALSGSLPRSYGHTCCGPDPFTSDNPTPWNPVPLSVLALSVPEPPRSASHTSPSPAKPSLPSHLGTLGPARTQNAGPLWPRGASWLSPTALPETHPTRPASKGPQSPGHLPADPEFWKVSGRCLGNASEERSPWALRLGVELRRGGGPRSSGSRVPSLPAARPAGPPGLLCRGWISPGLSELHGHQGEAALGYHRPGEHRRPNKHWKGSSTDSLLAAGNNYKVDKSTLSTQEIPLPASSVRKHC
uniref:Uncharacterized protein n=1 Tax=Mustela putorius furo TaxID=9669 RepID=M3Y4I6_MUSPF